MIMKLHFLLGLIILVVIDIVLSSASPAKIDFVTDNCKIENTAFQSGETIIYKAYYNWKFVWIPAGEATFNLIEKEDTYEITVIGKTYKSYDSFFKVRDYFHSEIDKNTMFPKSFVRIVEEGNYRKFDSIQFMQDKLTATSFNGRTKDTAIKKIIPIQQCTHDLLSVLYFMRNIEIARYNPGDQIPTKILFDETIYSINVKYEGKYPNFDIKDVGKMNTVKVIPDLVTGNVFKDGNRMHVWVTDDPNKLPLLIESPLSIGSAKAVLKSYSGLRYKMTEQRK